MTLCAGGCGKEALPGRLYHCVPSHPDYAACRQRWLRNPDNPRNQQQTRELHVTNVTSEDLERIEAVIRAEQQQTRELLLQAIPEAVERAVSNAIAQQVQTPTPPQNDALPDDTIGLLKVIAENTGYSVDDNNDIIKALQSIDKRLAAMEQQSRATYTPPPQGNMAPPRQSDDDLDDLLHEVELTEEQRAERGRQATQNFLSSLTALAGSGSKGPRKMETSPLAAPEFDDIEL